MKIETQEVILRKMIPTKGYVFKQANGDDTYEGIVYLSVEDSPDNYVEITIEEANAIKETNKEKTGVTH